MASPGLLVFFHCESNTGYAIASLEGAFAEMARRITGDDSCVHFAYRSLRSGPPRALPSGIRQVTEFDPASTNPSDWARMGAYIREHGIQWALGMDQPVHRPVYAHLRQAGLRKLVSYQGAPMSSLNHGVKLALKRLEVALRRQGPDHFIFESKAMARTATHGRGVPSAKVSVTYLGVDEDRYSPGEREPEFLRDEFGIPSDRRVIFYSGHMEERKGVSVLVRAAIEAVQRHRRDDLHLLILGNRAGEEERFLKMLSGTAAEGHVTFGGYRADVPRILRSCHIGSIASTGWDSFTMSALEMASAGLPLAVSNLQGLAETVDDGVTGRLFPPGDASALAATWVEWLDDHDLRGRLGAAARQRILAGFTREAQVSSLVTTCRRVFSG